MQLQACFLHAVANPQRHLRSRAPRRSPARRSPRARWLAPASIRCSPSAQRCSSREQQGWSQRRGRRLDGVLDRTPALAAWRSSSTAASAASRSSAACGGSCCGVAPADGFVLAAQCGPGVDGPRTQVVRATDAQRAAERCPVVDGQSRDLRRRCRAGPLAADELVTQRLAASPCASMAIGGGMRAVAVVSWRVSVVHDASASVLGSLASTWAVASSPVDISGLGCWRSRAAWLLLGSALARRPRMRVSGLRRLRRRLAGGVRASGSPAHAASVGERVTAVAPSVAGLLAGSPPRCGGGATLGIGQWSATSSRYSC